MGRAMTRTPLMAQHVPISLPSPGGGGVGGVGSICGVGGVGDGYSHSDGHDDGHDDGHSWRW